MIEVEDINPKRVSYCYTPLGYVDPLIVATAFPERNLIEVHVKEKARKIDEATDKWFNARKPSRKILHEIEELALSHLKPQSVVVTGCSQKKHDVSVAPAAELYDSTRITFVKRIASEENVPFFILSAEYGLAKGDIPIANYDQRMDEVSEEMIEKVVQQIRYHKIQTLTFFAAGTNKCYKQTLEEAAKRLPELDLRILGHSCMGGAKELQPLLQLVKFTESTESVEAGESPSCQLLPPIYTREASGQLRLF